MNKNFNYRTIVGKWFFPRHIPRAICGMILLLFSVAFLSESMTATKAFQRKMTYGWHNGYIYQVTAQGIELITNHQAIEALGMMTICANVLNEEYVAVSAIGTVDEGFQKLERLTILEGRWPEQEHEVIMETALLDTLHIPYELGQVVTLNFQMRDCGEILAKDYTLCGILESYTPNWKSEGNPLCGAFVLHGTDWDEAGIKHIFFQSIYKSAQEMEELRPLIQSGENTQMGYNDYAFPQDKETLVERLESGVSVLLVSVLAVLFFSALQMSCSKSHLQHLRLVLLLGADSRKLYRGLCITLFQLWLCCWIGCISVCSLGIVLFKGIGGQDIQFAWPVGAYLWSGGLSACVLVVSQVLQITILKQVKVIPHGYSVISEPLFEPRNKRTEPFTLRGFQSMERHRKRRYWSFTLMLGGCSFILLVLCLYGIGTVYQDYQFEISILSHDYEWTIPEPDVGLGKEQVERIGQTSCIRQIVAFSQNSGMQGDYVSLSFDGIQDDAYFSALSANRRHTCPEAPYYANVVAVSPDSPLWDYYFPDTIDQEAFLAGEIAVCYFPELIGVDSERFVPINHFKAAATCSNSSLTPNITAGTQMVISYQEHQIALSCVQIISQFPSVIQTSMDFLLPGSILISERAYCSLFGMEEMIYNHVFAYGSQDADYTTDKLMSYICSNKQINYSNYRQEKAEKYQQLLITEFFLGGIALINCIFALLMILRHHILYIEIERPRSELLKQLGCPRGIFQNTNSINHIWLMIFSFVVLLDFALLLYRIVYCFGSYYGLGDVSLSKIWRPISQVGLYQFPIAVFFLLQLVYFMVLILMTKTHSRQTVWKDNEYD